MRLRLAARSFPKHEAELALYQGTTLVVPLEFLRFVIEEFS